METVRKNDHSLQCSGDGGVLRAVFGLNTQWLKSVLDQENGYLNMEDKN